MSFKEFVEGKRVETRDLVVYLLMRKDLPSMNPGKAMAQAMHAGHQLLQHIAARKTDVIHDINEYFGRPFEADRWFGTVITLMATNRQIQDAINIAKEAKYTADLVIDPSYPFLVDAEIVPLLLSTEVKGVVEFMNGQNPPLYGDSKVLLTRPELTCGWMLGDRNDERFKEIVKGLPLHY